MPLHALQIIYLSDAVAAADGCFHRVTLGTTLFLHRHRLVDELAGRQLEGRWGWRILQVVYICNSVSELFILQCPHLSCFNVCLHLFRIRISFIVCLQLQTVFIRYMRTTSWINIIKHKHIVQASGWKNRHTHAETTSGQ